MRIKTNDSSFICLFFIWMTAFIWPQFSIAQPRISVSLDNGWKTIARDSLDLSVEGFEKASFNDKDWKDVNVPHNWDAYEGYRRMRHGNRHGYAWYRKSFTTRSSKKGKRFFLFFEGVGSYGSIWLNNKKVGYHAGGRTSFTLDVTDAIFTDGRKNTLAVRADHPAFIKNLPWVCGGCSEERGFSEGSQPLGIFRPVQLIITNDVRIEPFGVHVWTDSTVSEKSALLHMAITIKNYNTDRKNIVINNKLIDAGGKLVASQEETQKIGGGEIVVLRQQTPSIPNPNLWSIENPYLYSVVTEVFENGKLIDRLSTPYGIRWISWPIGKAASSNQFFLNGKPVFINGIAEYEHLLGASHAFGASQIRTRVMQTKAAGFNAFRDGHQPHNLRYNHYWDSLGILWWTQLSAHVWYDTPEFRENFKTLLKEWVIERRNSPSIVLWGLQNESKLPADFAKECTELIRSLDPTASRERLVTTCNGGEGTDWDVPQNWTGTYGGNPALYGSDVKRQVLIGEYGAWRTLDLHSEGGFVQDGVPYSEDRMTQLMEMKLRLAESVKDSTTGHFFWLLTSHDNPGRVQGGEGLRELDRIGPVNYKGLLTPWEEPLDVFYMFRSNYASKEKEPMVYIVSHTWPSRWVKPGIKDSIYVYSNCDEVELFNDVGHVSLGKRKRNGIGTHFQWDNVPIQYNTLYAVGYVNGKAVAKDYIVLNHLAEAPHFNTFTNNAKNITAPVPGYHYLYRVNCGGPRYNDVNNNVWMADRPWKKGHGWGSVSWTNDFTGMPAFFASQRQTNDPIAGTKDWPLFQSFRYGRDKLKYRFPLPDGEYLVELYFNEPWFGTGGGMDCAGWRNFDVAVNGKIVLRNLDIWNEVGHDKALRKTVKVSIKGGLLELSFPNIRSGQAVISAIAIASAKGVATPVMDAGGNIISNLKVSAMGSAWEIAGWMNIGDRQYINDSVRFGSLPSAWYGAEWIRTPRMSKASPNANTLASFQLTEPVDVFIAIDTQGASLPLWLQGYEDTKTTLFTDEVGGKTRPVFRKRYEKNATVILGENSAEQAPMYTVAVVPVSSIEPAYDLKATVGYKAAQADLSGRGIVKEIINGKENVAFKNAGGDTLQWRFDVGVADTYSLTIRYANTGKKTLSGKIQLLSADGTLMREENADFVTSNPGKWNYLSTSTGSMINAGNYLLRVVSVDAAGLGLSQLDVQ